MANQVILTQTGVGSTRVHMPDWRENPFSVSLQVLVTGTVNYTVQDTPDDCMAAVPTNFFNHPTLAAQTAAAESNYQYPVFGIRLTVNSGTGTATLIITQAARM